MPKSAQSQRNNTPFSDYSFVSCRLSDAQKEHFRKWTPEYSDGLEELLASVLVTGHKVSVSFDGENDCYIASFTCNMPGSTNRNKVLTSRAEGWTEALMLNLYKMNVVLQDTPWPTEQKKNNWG